MNGLMTTCWSGQKRCKALVCLVPLFMLIFGTSCDRSVKQPDQSVEENERVNIGPAGDFDDFFARFHSDSLYQIEHIIFPLQGLPDLVDSLTIASDEFRWTRARWRMQRPLDPRNRAFKRTLNVPSENFVVEYIVDQESGYGMERRFHRSDEEGWRLIYYVGMNRLAR